MMSTPISLRQRRDGVENDVALGRRHASGGLVEQQHVGLEAERDRELDQTLAPVGQFGDAMGGVVGELERFEQRHRLVDHLLAQACRLEHVGRDTEPLGDCDIDILQHREAAEQAVDLEGASDAELDALGLRHGGDVAALEQHLPGGRLEHAGQQVDERGLAGAVRPDQRVTRTGAEREVDVAGGGERAEIDGQLPCFEERRGHGCVLMAAPA